MNEGIKKRIFFTIAVVICALGFFGTLTRKDPVEKNIGYVYLSDGDKVETLQGYKTKVNYNGRVSKYEYPQLAEKVDKLVTIDVTEENMADMTISYSDDNYKAEYTLYDSEFNAISEKTSGLELPSQTDKTYYVSILVKWGSEKQNVSMIYYFSIET